MLKNLVVIVALLVLASSAMATGIPPVTSDPSNVWSGIDLPGFSFHYGTSTAGGKTNFDAYMSNSDRIRGTGINLSLDASNPLHGYISANFSGVVGDTPVLMPGLSQSMDITRHGVEYSSFASLSSYQQMTWVGDKDGYPIYGDWLSTGSANMSLFNVTPSWANMNYSEYVDPWDNTRYFNGSVSWQVDFSAPAYDGFGASVSSAATPEPATLAFLAIGGIALAGRQLRRRQRVAR